MHQIGTQNTVAQPEKQHVKTAKTRGPLWGLAGMSTGNNKKTQITELEETEGSDTDKSISLITEIKHVTAWWKPITMTGKADGTEEDFIVDTGSPVKIEPPDEETVKNNKLVSITGK